MNTIECRECGHRISRFAHSCPRCGVSHPADERLDGRGFEYKSKFTLFGLPLIHISFRWRFNGTPVPAIGIVAIGQFGLGVINISQFGIGVLSVAQFTVAGYALAQVAVAYSLIAQVGVFLHHGVGQAIVKLSQIL